MVSVVVLLLTVALAGFVRAVTVVATTPFARGTAAGSSGVHFNNGSAMNADTGVAPAVGPDDRGRRTVRHRPSSYEMHSERRPSLVDPDVGRSLN